MNADKARHVPNRIVDEFEGPLSDKRVMIPHKDREGEEEASIYGTEYNLLEDADTNTLIKGIRLPQGEVKEISDQEKQLLAEALADLLRTNGKVRSALFDAVCQCPNLVVEY